MSASESEDAELERGKALMKGDSLVTRFCLYGFLKSAPPALRGAVLTQPQAGSAALPSQGFTGPPTDALLAYAYAPPQHQHPNASHTIFKHLSDLCSAQPSLARSLPQT